jgi:ABC-type hemin transport system ATPase subunit
MIIGKSSFLKSLIGEIQLLSGRLEINGTMAYVWPMWKLRT